MSQPPRYLEHLRGPSAVSESRPRQKHIGPFPGPHYLDLQRRAIDDRWRQMDDLSEDGTRCRRTSADHGRLGGAPLHNRAFANSWLDQAEHLGTELARLWCRRARDPGTREERACLGRTTSL